MAKRSKARAAALPTAALDFFRKHGAKGGRKGGSLSWAALTPEQRSARAKKASLAAAKVRQARAKKARG
jgi:hypothetical protein